jgi:uncharacterized protein involved in response to NO
MSDSAATTRQRVAASGERYLFFLATSLSMAVGLGFVLAILLPVAVALQASWGLRWQALAQVHGHVQVVGFAGLFIVGMAYRLVPRFSGVPLRNPWTLTPAGGLLVAGVLLRALTQPLNDVAAFGWGPALASVCELCGAALFCLSVLPTLWRPLRAGQPWAPFMAAGAIWFLVQAVLGAWFLVTLSIAGSPLNALPGGRTVLPDDRDTLLLTLQFYGFLLGFIFGVATRAVPTFFAHRPSVRVVRAAWLLLQAGLLLFAGEALQTIIRQAHVVGLQVAGLLCLGAALLAAAGATGSWKPASRLRPSARGAAGLLRAAFGWCAIAGTMDIAFAFKSAIQGQPLAGNEADAVRHVLAVGVITTMILAMGHLLVPALATQRLAGLTARRRLLLLQTLLIGAVVLRAGPPLITGLNARVSFSLIGAAGVLAWLAVALFSSFLLKAHREQATIIEAITGDRGVG